MEFKKFLKKVWWFIWEDDSAASWVVNIILAFLIVKFLLYPGLGLVFATDYPIVAVVSGSMEHNGLNYDDWWLENSAWYEEQGFTKTEFKNFIFNNGFNTGDIIFLKGIEPKDINIGEVVVYETHLAAYPIIHRVVDKEGNNFITKGDNVDRIDPEPVTKEQIVGVAMFKVPYLGWVKIIFNNILSTLQEWFL